MFSFYTLGVMSGAAEEVATGAEVTVQSILQNGICTFLYFLLILDKIDEFSV